MLGEGKEKSRGVAVLEVLCPDRTLYFCSIALKYAVYCSKSIVVPLKNALV